MLLHCQAPVSPKVELDVDLIRSEAAISANHIRDTLDLVQLFVLKTDCKFMRTD